MTQFEILTPPGYADDNLNLSRPPHNPEVSHLAPCTVRI